MADVHLALEEPTRGFSKAVPPSYKPTDSMGGRQLPTSSPALRMVSLFNVRPSNRQVVISRGSSGTQTACMLGHPMLSQSSWVLCAPSSSAFYSSCVPFWRFSIAMSSGSYSFFSVISNLPWIPRIVLISDLIFLANSSGQVFGSSILSHVGRWHALCFHSCPLSSPFSPQKPEDFCLFVF